MHLSTLQMPLAAEEKERWRKMKTSKIKVLKIISFVLDYGISALDLI